MRNQVLIRGFSAVLPPYCRAQHESFEWLAEAHARAAATQASCEDILEKWRDRMTRRIGRYSCSEEHIGWRRSEVRDYMHADWLQMEIFNLHENPRGRGLGVRNAVYSAAVRRALESLYARDLDPPSDLLHVSCTGYVSPSAVQRLIERKGWNGETKAVQVYHMGCYAALPALRIAAGLVNNYGAHIRARADIVHNELCTLHFNPADHSPEQLIIQTLFADGHIRYSVLPKNNPACRPDEGALDVLAFQEEIVPDSVNDMTWELSDWGFQMTLSRDVPGKISSRLPGFLSTLFQNAGLSYCEQMGKAIFAVHPGGPRILDSVAELLGLELEQLRHSRKVLFERGNMSSATLPHIWMATVEDPSVRPETPIISLAFGPGLTIAGALFRKC
jgi:predicted naringenin-chalcone synthase